MPRTGRRPNFRKEEMETLIRALESRRDMINGEFGRMNSNAWNRVAEEVNASNDCSIIRTGKEVMTKWKFFKLDMKKTILMKRGLLEECKRKRRPQSPLTPLELRIESLIGEESLQRGLMVPNTGNATQERNVNVTQHVEEQIMKNEDEESYSEGSSCSMNNYNQFVTPAVEIQTSEMSFVPQEQVDVTSQRHDELMKVLRELSHHVKRLADVQEAKLQWEVKRITS